MDMQAAAAGHAVNLGHGVVGGKPADDFFQRGGFRLNFKIAGDRPADFLGIDDSRLSRRYDSTQVD